MKKFDYCFGIFVGLLVVLFHKLIFGEMSYFNIIGMFFGLIILMLVIYLIGDKQWI